MLKRAALRRSLLSLRFAYYNGQPNGSNRSFQRGSAAVPKIVLRGSTCELRFYDPISTDASFSRD